MHLFWAGLIVLFQLTILVAGEAGKIAGTLIDKQTGEPLAGANLVWQSDREIAIDRLIGVATDLQGQFLILNVQPGYYSATTSVPPNKINTSLIIRNLIFAQKQYSNMLSRIGNSNRNPRTTNQDGSIKLVPSGDWTSGFFPGCLWLLYEFSQDEKWKIAAQQFTANVEQEQFDATTHDMGFKMFCSFGNGYRLIRNENYKDILLQSARTLITRFNPKIGCIRSWDHNKDLWQYPVIIDNMMNLELLFWAAKASGDSTFYRIAVTHANTTLKNHFREDNSSWHVVNYDTTAGEVLTKETHQGYSNDSAWARGQAWGLYGYTMSYRETKDGRYLAQAQSIADFILNHNNLPEDVIPYWDFDAPDIPNEERDASAGAIMCSALYELSTHLGEGGLKYKQAADKILASLSSTKYKAGANSYFLLMHSVGSKPGKVEIDVPLIYADYYFLEANLRKSKIEAKF